MRCHVRAFRADFFTVWRCANCGSLHSAERVDLAPYYAQYPLRRQKTDVFNRIALRKRLRMLNGERLQRSQSILDYGCGRGAFLDVLRQDGFTDVGGYDAYVSSYADSTVLSRQYDLVTSYDVIEHFHNPRDFMATVADLVKPDGLLAIGTPNADALSITGPGDIPVDISQPYHRHILSERVLLALAAGRGFLPVATYRRFCADTLFPGVNARFAWAYVQATGGMLDAITEPIRATVILRSPRLIFDALFGYFFPQPGYIFVVFKRQRRVGS